MRTPLVRFGEDHYHQPQGGIAVHTMSTAYGEMLRQVMRDYSGLPPFWELSLSDIRFLYEGLRDELKAITKPR